MGESREDIEARVCFELALKQLKGNYSSIKATSFKGANFSLLPQSLPQLCDVLALNMTCTALDLTNTSMTDAGVQQLAVALCDVSKAPQLLHLNLCDNPLSAVSETVVAGLSKLRPNLRVSIGSGPLTAGFVCEKELVEGLSAWPPEELKVRQSLVPNSSPRSVPFMVKHKCVEISRNFASLVRCLEQWGISTAHKRSLGKMRSGSC